MNTTTFQTDCAKPVIGPLVRGLPGTAMCLEVVAVIYAILGPVAGIAIAIQRHATFDPRASDRVTYPYVALGVSVAVSSVVLGVLMWCIARAIHIFAIDTAFRHGLELIPSSGTQPMTPWRSLLPNASARAAASAASQTPNFNRGGS
jgi:hypothetical protein